VGKPDDPHLVSRLRAGRPEACAEIVHIHYASVYRFLVRLTRDIHQAEDLVQETFATAWQKAADFRGRATLTTWLHRIAYTKFLDARRAGRREVGLRERLAVRLDTPSGLDPCAAVGADDEAERLDRLLHMLDAPLRALLVLHYFQGLSYREMADVLQEPVGTVKWRTGEALDRLRSLLTRDEVPQHASRPTSGS
jgi:RNA polymerase sigma-70 factor (ECF subfamily)